MKVFHWFIHFFILHELCFCEIIENLLMKSLQKISQITEVTCSDGQLVHVPWRDEDLQTLMEKLFKKLKEIAIDNDTFHYNDVNYFDKDGYGLIFRGSGGNFIVQGTASMNVSHLVATHNDTLHFELILTFGEVQLTGYYNFTFDILTMLPLFGAGDFGLIVPSLTLNITMDLKQTIDQILQITESNFLLKIPKFEVDFENLLGSKVYSKLIPAIINDVAEDLVGYEKYVMKILNVASRINNELCNIKFTYDKMIDAITHFIQ
ncbi:uncharacterized protein LOC106661331 [Cimex lectularius]|uniref:Juvenile hormone binding protein n=1 Tax=Cimex lectularius TaxID=79782 RepID=A0A8I6R992_CIMLE|nr:uncharacterized protein LOC106661331 [Cimex lectularius]